MDRRKGRGVKPSESSSEGEDDLRPSTTSKKRRKPKAKGNPRGRGRQAPVAAANDSSASDADDEDAELRRAIELSRKEVQYISDSDEDMKRAIALSLDQAEADRLRVVPVTTAAAVRAAPATTAPTCANDSAPTLVVSDDDDEFDQMCSSDLSLKERLSKSSLDSEEEAAAGEEGTDSVRIITNRRLNEDNANLPGPSNIPLMKGKGPSGSGSSSCPVEGEEQLTGSRSADPVSSSSAAGARPSSSLAVQRARSARPVHYVSEDEAESEFAATCSSLIGGGPATLASYHLNQTSTSQGLLSSAEVRERMRSVFTRGLENHLTQEEMEPCKAVATRLHPHQKTALAWMTRQESKDMHGMKGGILADDMGLGKTLTVISLILTNFHDGRPLCKPEIGYVRPQLEILRQNRKGGRKKVGATAATSQLPDFTTIGSKIKKNTEKKSIFSFFDKFKEFDELDQKSESEKKKKNLFSNGRGEKSKPVPQDAQSDTSEEDEFDRMSQEDSLSMRLKVCSRESFKTVADPREEEEEDSNAEELLEELESLSQEERSRRLRPVRLPSSSDDEQQVLPNPALNLDGAFDSDSDDNVPLVNGGRGKAGRIRSDDEEDGEAAAASSSSLGNGCAASRAKRLKLDSDSDVHLSDIDLDNVEPAPSCSSSSSLATAVPGAAGGVKRLYPPRDPAQQKGRRRATLLVCPTSLISHWCQEIDKHVEPNVPLRLKIHHGSTKALTGADLSSCDIVITTYGVLAAECDSEDAGPLQRAKFLRVVLDEGHCIKNHRTKSARAANNLDTERRWVITGTPIQNNLLELWSLVNWLRFGVYADQLPAFKNQIERPCNSRDPRGFERLQVLMDAICLRRTKNDRKSNGEPIVHLPNKTVKIRDVELTEEERLCYTVLNNMAKDIVMRYQRRGQLLRNYAHIFALMMRMRQMCCHRELIQTMDWVEALRDKAALERQLGQLVAQDGGGEAAGEEGAQPHLVTQLRNMLRAGITDDCSICLDDLKTPVITPCAHVFCRQCIERCLEAVKPPSCPLCRRHVEKAQLLEAGNYDEESDRTEDATLAAMKDIIVQHTSSKVDAVLREILRIQRDQPEDKIIVVSQFTSFLSMIQPLLEERCLSFCRLDGTMSHLDRAEVVKEFQSRGPASPRILLLSLKAGGVGLNLTAANHLLLLDPAWNPAAEWQCFDRVHRLGQDKEVFIYKFITKESIETKMMELQEKKEELITGAFIMPDEDRRRQRIQDILNIFNLA